MSSPVFFRSLHRSVQRIAAAVALTAVLAPAAHAQSPVLDKIRETGTITLGYRESALPFSFGDDKQQGSDLADKGRDVGPEWLRVGTALAVFLDKKRFRVGTAGHTGWPSMDSSAW